LRHNNHIQSDPTNKTALVRAIPARIRAIANGCASMVCGGSARALDDISIVLL
jgi:hypothetical protein